MKQDGYLKVLTGVTTIDEILRVAQEWARSWLIMDLNILLQKAIDTSASDLHLMVGLPPVYRINGMLQQLPSAQGITEQVMEQMIY